VYTAAGELVKTEAAYLKPADYDITPAAGRVHGLTLAFLERHGQGRHAVMQRLLDDLRRYDPLVVGHFMELDFHMVGVTLHRAGLPNELVGRPLFCTMRLTEDFVRIPGRRFMRLPELYERLFGQPMLREHDALVDAQATADCYWELSRRGEISPDILRAQWQPRLPVARRPWWRTLFS
jgi:DNA polymerase-3 subunit epsilon